MSAQYGEIQELLRSRADLRSRLSLLPYDGTPEIKEHGKEKYLYIRKRVAGKLTSTYVGIYTDELYNLLLRNAREARAIRRALRAIEKQLAEAQIPTIQEMVIRRGKKIIRVPVGAWKEYLEEKEKRYTETLERHQKLFSELLKKRR